MRAGEPLLSRILHTDGLRMICNDAFSATTTETASRFELRSRVPLSVLADPGAARPDSFTSRDTGPDDTLHKDHLALAGRSSGEHRSGRRARSRRLSLGGYDGRARPV